MARLLVSRRLNASRRNTETLRPRPAFTLIELLVTIAIVSLLLSILVPNLSAARAQARAAVCASNVRQLALANQMYAHENQDRACPGAVNFVENRHRWHGVRSSSSGAFDSALGPLVPYLGADGAIRQCPQFRNYDSGGNGFELGNGGYGYNNAFVGTVVRPLGGVFHIVETDLTGTLMSRVRNPAGTVFFTDAAFAAVDLIEYSFVEPRFFPTNGFRPDPSVHFRHSGGANVAWGDGHVDRRKRTFTWSSGLYDAQADRFNIGWFGRRDDNSLFDLR